MTHHDWLSPADMVTDYGIPLTTSYYWRRTGGGPAVYKVGRRLKYKRADVEAWIEAQRVCGGAAQAAC